MKYVYPAVFYKDKELPETYTVIFPDVEGAVTQGETLFNAMEMAEDALCGMLVMWEDFKAGRDTTPMTNRIDPPTPLEKVVAVPDEYSTSAFVTLIKADTDAYRKILEVMPPQEETESDEDFEVPETYARELCRVAGIKYPFEVQS